MQRTRFSLNAMTPVDLQQYSPSNDKFDSTAWARSSMFLLYISFGISVAEAAFALIINVWLTRYQHSLTGMGPTIHDRIRKRYEAYTGLMDWRLPMLIESLPMMALVALLLFAVFIRYSMSNALSQWHSYSHSHSRDFIWKDYPMIGDALENIFITISIFFVSTTSVAAFIPGAPFHSPLSSFIRLSFRIFPNRSILGVVRIRTICVIFICGISLAIINFRLSGFIRILLIFLSSVSVVSLCERTPEERKPQKQPKPRLFSLATWCLYHFIVLTALFLAMSYLRRGRGYLRKVLFSLIGVIFVIVTIVAVQMSQWTPDEDKAKAEAVAWMIKTQSHHLATFQNAIDIAQNSAHLRSTLLKDILPVLNVLIQSIQGIREQDLEDDEKIYIKLLAVLVDFEPSEAVFWRNEAAVKQPVLSKELREKLHILCKSGCTVHNLPPAPLSGCTKAEAEFILGKVGEVDGVQRESV
jgi:hypothetical protein